MNTQTTTPKLTTSAMIASFAEPALNVNVVGGLPGLTTGDGPSHQATEDLAMLRGMPNLTIVDPCDSVDIEQAVPTLAAHPGPTYMRLGGDEVEAIRRLDGRIGHVHLRDAVVSDINLSIGRGNVDFPAAIEALTTSGYRATTAWSWKPTTSPTPSGRSKPAAPAVTSRPCYSDDKTPWRKPCPCPPRPPSSPEPARSAASGEPPRMPWPRSAGMSPFSILTNPARRRLPTMSLSGSGRRQ